LKVVAGSQFLTARAAAAHMVANKGADRPAHPLHGGHHRSPRPLLLLCTPVTQKILTALKVILCSGSSAMLRSPSPSSTAFRP
jgi:hypothetical protein